MDENTTHIITPTVKPTFEGVCNQFETWRKRRRCRGRVPEALWQAAVGLCQNHSVGEVSRTLRLNYNGLKNRVPKARDTSLAAVQRADLGFVKLDLRAPIMPSECLVEMEAPNGAKMRMSFKGASRDFDPVELSRAFWRQGR